MDSLVIYRDYTFLYSPSLMYPLRVWLMMCALCMREVGGLVLIFPSPTAAADTDTGWSRRYWLVTGDCLRLLDCLGVFLIFSTRVHFSYSPPGCISHILQGAFLRSRKLTGGVAEGIGSLLAAAGFCVHRTPASLLPHLFNTAHHCCGQRSSYMHTVFLYHRAVLDFT